MKASETLKDRIIDTLDKTEIVKFFNKYKDWIFLAAFCPMIFIDTWASTTFSVSITVLFRPLAETLVLTLIPLKIIFTEYRYWKRLVVYISVFILVYLIDYYASEDGILFMVLFTIGIKDVSIKKVITSDVIIKGAIITLATVCAITGIIPDKLTMLDGVQQRHSLGAIYPTDYGAHLSFLFLEIIFVFKEKIKKRHLLLTLIIVCIVWKYAHPRLDMICIILTIIAYIFFDVYERKKWVFLEKGVVSYLYKKCSAFAMPIGYTIITVLCLIYKEGTMRFVPSTVTSRFIIGKRAYYYYGITPFGFTGDLAKMQLDYVGFLDSSYLHILFFNGVIFLALFFTIHFFIAKKYENNKFILYWMSIIAINGILAHHLSDFVFNISPFFLLCNMDVYNKDKIMAKK